MTAVIQSPPHEIARQEKLAHLAAVDAREELQRRHSQGQADAGADAEREALSLIHISEPTRPY